MYISICMHILTADIERFSKKKLKENRSHASKLPGLRTMIFVRGSDQNIWPLKRGLERTRPGLGWAFSSSFIKKFMLMHGLDHNKTRKTCMASVRLCFILKQGQSGLRQSPAARPSDS
ncbi:hypothetical protein KSP39_PZI021077 [Platanthera zijinensis]|uniref:Uncharacterized protein n=1 Tax=Platanthera zijinensis TaxID=2320716 RepID=A0AAP0AYE9_9ASPA